MCSTTARDVVRLAGVVVVRGGVVEVDGGRDVEDVLLVLLLVVGGWVDEDEVLEDVVLEDVSVGGVLDELEELVDVGGELVVVVVGGGVCVVEGGHGVLVCVGVGLGWWRISVSVGDGVGRVAVGVGFG